jgi:hypothetical protein
MTDTSTTLHQLSARGITTLEQLVQSKSRMRKPKRIDSAKAFEEILTRSAARAGSSAKSKIGPPAPTVPIVLDGKRVDYKAIARLNGQPLDYVAATLKSGEPALVAFSDRSIMRNHHLRQFNTALRAIGGEVENALMAVGLQAAPLTARINLGLRICEDINYGGDSWTFAPEEYVPDLTEFDEGLGPFDGDWNDKISSVQMGRCYMQAWEDINEGGATLTLHQDTPDLHVLGWGDVISGIWAPFTN